MTTPLAQLRALLALRWAMVRTIQLRVAVLLSVVLLVGLVGIVAALPAVLPGTTVELAVDLAPQAFLGFGVLAVIAPLSTLGGNEVMPPHQLVAYPVRPATHFLGGLVLAPVNLVWVFQLLALTFVTAVLARGGNVLLASLTTGMYVVALAVVGQTLTWAVVGVRATRRGRRLLVGGAIVIFGAVALLGVLGGLDGLAGAVSNVVVTAVRFGAAGGGATWALVTASLMVLSAGAGWAGVRVCAWASSRPSDALAHVASDVRRAPTRRTALAQMIAVDRRSVWRAPALRRGCLIMSLLPLALSLSAPLPWSSLIVLPGLVAAGAGLLFGVNLFSLDGSGALWLASLPAHPRVLVQAKLWVLTETVLGVVLLTALMAALRSPESPTPAQLSALLASAVVCTAAVVAQCLSLSIRRPHPAVLSSPRSAIAPPGALVAASARLAGVSALVSVVVDVGASTGRPAAVPLLALPVLALAILSVWRSLRLWSDAQRRARVVGVVASV